MNYFDIVQLQAGEWEVRNSKLPTVMLGSRELAKAIAFLRCKESWEKDKLPCGVRIRRRSGSWEELLLFGMQ